MNKFFLQKRGAKNLLSKEDPTNQPIDPSSPKKVQLKAVKPKVLSIGHIDDINSFEIFPQQSKALTASRDKTVKIWNLDTLKVEHTLFHDENVWQAIITPDSKKIITALGNKDIIVYDAENYNVISEFYLDVGTLNQITCSSDSKKAVFSGHSTFGEWDLTSYQCIRIFEGHTYMIKSVYYSQDLSKIMSGSCDKTVKLWETQSGKILKSQSIEGPVTIAKYSPDFKKIIAAETVKKINILDAETLNIEKTISCHDSYNQAIVFSPNEQIMFSIGNGKKICKFNTENYEIIKEYDLGDEYYEFGSFIDNGSKVALLSTYGELALYDYPSLNQTKKSYYVNSRVEQVQISPDGKLLAVVQFACVCLWNLKTLEQQDIFIHEFMEIEQIQFSQNSQFIADSAHSLLSIWDLKEKKAYHKFQNISISDIVSLCFLLEDQFIAISNVDNEIKILSLETKECVKTIENNDFTNVKAIISSPNSQLIYAGMNNSIKIWDAKNKFESTSSHLVANRIESLDISPNGQILVSTEKSGLSIIWKIQGKSIKLLARKRALIQYGQFKGRCTRFYSNSVLVMVGFGRRINFQSLYSKTPLLSIKGYNGQLGQGDISFDYKDNKLILASHQCLVMYYIEEDKEVIEK